MDGLARLAFVALLLLAGCAGTAPPATPSPSGDGASSAAPGAGGSSSSATAAPATDCPLGTEFGPVLTRLPFWAQGQNETFVDLVGAFKDPLDPSREGDNDQDSRWTVSDGLLTVYGSPTQWVAASRHQSPAPTREASESYMRDVFASLGLPAPETFGSWPDPARDGDGWTLTWTQATPAGPMGGGTAHFNVGNTGAQGMHVSIHAMFEPLPGQPSINHTQAREAAAAQAECLGHVDRSTWESPLEGVLSNGLEPGGEPERLRYVIRVPWGQDKPALSQYGHGCPGPSTFVTVDAVTGAVVDWRVDKPTMCA